MPSLIDRPIFVIGCNRSGTTLLYNNLAEHPSTWKYYEESQHVYHRHFPGQGDEGERVGDPPTPDIGRAVAQELYDDAHNKERFRDTPILEWIPRKLLQRPVGRLYKPTPLRLLEKTPANTLRIPFLASLFPDARFLFLLRRAEAVISSLMEGWKNWSNVPRGGAWQYGGWHYLRPPGWQQWTGRTLEEICAFQWIESTRMAWDDLEQHASGSFMVVRYEETLDDPVGAYRGILDFCELEPSTHLTKALRAQDRRVFTHGGSAPKREKWRTLHEKEIERVRPMFEPLMARCYGPSS